MIMSKDDRETIEMVSDVKGCEDFTEDECFEVFEHFLRIRVID